MFHNRCSESDYQAIVKEAGLDLADPEKWESYHRSGTGIRQIAMIREYRKAKVFDEQARQVMLTAMEKSQ